MSVHDGRMDDSPCVGECSTSQSDVDVDDPYKTWVPLSKPDRDIRVHHVPIRPEEKRIGEKERPLSLDLLRKHWIIYPLRSMKRPHSAISSELDDQQNAGGLNSEDHGESGLQPAKVRSTDS